MNYKQWEEEDRRFIGNLMNDLKEFQRLEEKYAFNLALRVQFKLTVMNLLELIKRLKAQFKEDYAETHKHLH